MQILDLIISFTREHHQNLVQTALKKGKKQLRAMDLARFAKESQGTGSVPLTSLPPHGKQGERRKATSVSSGSVPIPKKPRTGTPSATPSAALGSNAGGVSNPPPAKETKKKQARAPKMAVALEKVPTHLEAQKSMSQASRMQYQEDLLARCAIQIDTITVDIGSLYPPIRDRNVELPPYQVRHVQPYFLEQLTKRMAVYGASALATPFVLLVDPEMCASREDFDFAKKNEYKYFVIGGNHSACAKADLTLTNPQYGAYRRVSAWIFAGLSVREARNLAWGHNIDSEFRSQMSTIQRLNYIHLRLMESGGQPSQDLKKECAMEIQLKDWGNRKDTDVLNANDNLFQLAFRKEPIWGFVSKIFDKWEACEIKGQKIKETKKPKAKETVIDSKPPYEDMKLTEWKLMQPLKDADVVIPVLQRVINKELSLQEMGQEFKRLKYMGIVQKAFLSSLVEPSWSACKTKYTEHCTDEILKNFVPLFSTWVSIY